MSEIKNEKKYIIGAVIILVMLAWITIVLVIAFRENYRSKLYQQYQYPNEEFYGKKLYSEIDYKCSDYEAEVGNQILHKAIEVAEYTGTKQEAENEIGEVGALERYYYFDSKDAVSQEVEFQFITCKLTEDTGHVWVVSTVLRVNENGKRASNSGRDCLDLWYIEKQGEEWQVVKAVSSP